MNTIKFVNNIFSASDESESLRSRISKIRKDLFSKGICWTDSVNGEFIENEPFTIILYLRNNSIQLDFANPIISECNGLVMLFSSNTFSLLVLPVANFNKSKLSIKRLNELYVSDYYNLYEALDATIINLYYYNNSWRISTNRGYDVTNLLFSNNKTYLETFTNLLKTKYYKFDWDNLNKLTSYTIAMRVSDYHIFNETRTLDTTHKDKNSYLKLLHMANVQEMKTITLTKTNTIGIGPYLPIVVKNAHSLSVLIDYAKHAYDRYERSLNNTNNSFKFKPLYGYVLRAKSSATPIELSNILFESSLFKLIKYNLYKNTHISEKMLIAKMSLNYRHKKQLKLVFNQFSKKMELLDAILLATCENASAVVTTNKHITKDLRIQNFSNKIIENMTKKELINDKSVVDKTVIYDYIHNYEYLDDLVSFL